MAEVESLIRMAADEKNEEERVRLLTKAARIALSRAGRHANMSRDASAELRKLIRDKSKQVGDSSVLRRIMGSSNGSNGSSGSGCVK